MDLSTAEHRRTEVRIADRGFALEPVSAFVVEGHRTVGEEKGGMGRMTEGVVKRPDDRGKAKESLAGGGDVFGGVTGRNGVVERRTEGRPSVGGRRREGEGGLQDRTQEPPRRL